MQGSEIVTKEDEKKICRICLADESTESPSMLFIQPCRCKGTVRNVHMDCLTTWIRTDVMNNTSCQVCKQEFLIVLTWKALKHWSLPPQFRNLRYSRLLLVFPILSTLLWALNLLIYTWSKYEFTPPQVYARQPKESGVESHFASQSASAAGVLKVALSLWFRLILIVVRKGFVVGANWVLAILNFVYGSTIFVSLTRAWTYFVYQNCEMAVLNCEEGR